MISVVVCSQSVALFKAFEYNVLNTIGCDAEVIRIDNADKRFSICAAYNYGYAQTSFPIVCFVHEDVLFQTSQWGILLTDYFNNNEKIGVIGIAGGVYKTRVASPWWASEPGWKEHKRMNLIQHYKNNTKPSRSIFINPFNEQFSEVISVDGVFMAVRKNVLLNYSFDDQLLTGFHGYDLDFCLKVSERWKIAVVYNITLEHFSGGNTDLNWYADLLNIHFKWQKSLPAYTNQFKPVISNVYRDGWKRIKKNLSFCINHGITFRMLCRVYISSILLLENKPFFLNFLVTCTINTYRIIRMFLLHKKMAEKPLV
jgi:hypothetical protein